MVGGVTASCNVKQVSFFFLSISFCFLVKIIDHFTSVDLVPSLHGCEADGDLVSMQTSFALL